MQIDCQENRVNFEDMSANPHVALVELITIATWVRKPELN